jgi:hypothetical protein
MDIKGSIWENLLSSRNILLNSQMNEHVLPCLHYVLNNLSFVPVDSTQSIFKFCITEVIEQIHYSEFLSAGMILNLIHNLPLDQKDEEEWDVDYFLSIELAGFLEQFELIRKSGKIVLFVCRQLNFCYLEDKNIT